MFIEIMDTTLRDGEQTSGVSFARQEKLSIARLLLEELKIPRIEIASARVSSGEYETATQLCEWARKRGHIDKIEILGFLDNGASIEWIRSCGARVMNLLCKGSEKHCTFQLKKTVQEHIADIKAAIRKAREAGLKINLYLEDWSNGIQHSPQYVYQLVDELKNEAMPTTTTTWPRPTPSRPPLPAYRGCTVPSTDWANGPGTRLLPVYWPCCTTR